MHEYWKYNVLFFCCKTFFVCLFSFLCNLWKWSCSCKYPIEMSIASCMTQYLLWKQNVGDQFVLSSPTLCDCLHLCNSYYVPHYPQLFFFFFFLRLFWSKSWRIINWCDLFYFFCTLLPFFPCNWLAISHP